MTVTIDLITADFNATPNPTFEFLQGRNMDVLSIRTTLRKIEESEEGRLFEGNPDPDGLIVKSSGNEVFNAAAGESNALTVTILPVFEVKFQAGGTPYVSSGGNLLFKGLNSPGAIVQINNAVGAVSLSSADIEHASFNNGVTLDVINGSTIAAGATGNSRQPLNNLANVKTVLSSRGFNKIFVVGDFTFGASDNIDGFVLQSSSSLTSSTLTFVAGCSADRTSFSDTHLIGVISGDIIAFQDHLLGLTCGAGTIFHDCLYEAPTIFIGTGKTSIIDGVDGTTGLAPSEFDFTAVAVPDVIIAAWSGGLGLIGIGAGNVVVDFLSGKAHLRNTCVGGEIVLRPSDIVVEDLSGPACTVVRTVIDEAYGGGVTIDVINGTAGTEHPVGTRVVPVNNLADALIIGNKLNFLTHFIKGNVTCGASDNIDGLTVVGVGTILTNVITVIPGCSTQNTKFKDLTLQGTLKGDIESRSVVFKDIIDMGYGSWLLDSWMEQDITLKGGGTFIVINCGVGNSPGALARPNFDYANVPLAQSNFLRWSGNIGFRNVSAGNISLNVGSGKAFLESNNTGGDIFIRPEQVDIDDETPLGGLKVHTELERFRVLADAGNTALSFKTDLISTEPNVYKDSIIQVLPTIAAGGLARQVKKVLSYNATTKFVTLTSALSSVPAANVKGKLINE